MKHHIRLAKRDIMALTGPCVYLFRKEHKALYCGSSKNGIVRAIAPNHSFATKAQIGCDELFLYFFKKLEDARYHEAYLIETLRPLYNAPIRKRKIQRDIPQEKITKRWQILVKNFRLMLADKPTDYI